MPDLELQPLSQDVLDGIKSSKEIAQALRKTAGGLQKQINDKLNPAISRQNPTARRMRIAEGMEKDGLQMQQIQEVLYALADAHESGEIQKFPLLSAIRNRKQVSRILYYETVTEHNLKPANYFTHDQVELKKQGIHSVEEWIDAYDQVNRLVKSDSAESIEKKNQQGQQTRIKQLERDVIGRKIPGFFPTPSELSREMIRFAEIQPGNSVLDPSAGKGDLLEEVTKEFGDQVDISAIEINPTLKDILDQKGIPHIEWDFLEFTGKTFDRILMNPPFEKGQDIDHVLQAYSLLNPGGRLVAIVSEGPFFRKFKKDESFRSWLQQHQAKVTQPIKDAFKNAFKQTGITVRIVAIDKAGTANNKQTALELEARKHIAKLKKLFGEDLSGHPSKSYLDLDNATESYVLQDADKKEKTSKTIPEVKLQFIRPAEISAGKLTTSGDAARLLRSLFEQGTMDLQEHFIVLYLNRANKVIGYYKLSKGGITGTVADPKLILAAGINCLCSGIILCHNHPSGELSPSKADLAITQRIQQGCAYLDITLLDHIILTSEGMYSLSDEGLITHK